MRGTRASAEREWLDFAADLMSAPLTALPEERVALRLRETFDAVGVTSAWLGPGHALDGEIYPLDQSLNGLRAQIRAWAFTHAVETHPLVRHLRATGETRPVQLADVPPPFHDGYHRDGAALMAAADVAHQLHLPLVDGRHVRSFVIGRPSVFDSDELLLAGRIWRLLIGMDRQARAYAVAVRHAGPTCEDHAGEVALTPRERGVLDLLAMGFTAAAIARRLSIAERTVHKHLERCYDKLGVADRLAAVLRAQRLGLVAPTVAAIGIRNVADAPSGLAHHDGR